MTLHQNGIPARLVDVLETDGGWLTVDGLAHQLDAKFESVRRALERLAARGIVEHRSVPLALMSPPAGSYRGGSGPRGLDIRSEWRLRT
jgi:predicted ArsR family transcriptional regulator